MAARVTRPNPCFLDDQIKVSRDGVQRWRDSEGTRFYEWDGLHGEIEVYNQRGKHMGTVNATTGVWKKGPKKGRRIDV